MIKPSKIEMNTATFRFYAELNDFLHPKRRFICFKIDFPNGQTVKHMVESCGIPHTEVDLILVNGNSVDFSYQLKDGDQVSVYPIFETLDISLLTKLRPSPLRKSAFVLDCHLGRLAAYMRLLGFDVLYRNDYSDEELAEISEKQKRICITRDRGLLKRNQIQHGYLVRDTQPRAQVVELVRRFQLVNQIKPFTRCSKCNGLLQPVEKMEIMDVLLPGTRENFHSFYQCDTCRQVYWKGSHYEQIERFVDYVNQKGGDG